MSDPKTRRLPLVCSIVVASSLLGCGNKEDGKTKSEGAASELEGTWELACIATKDSQGEVDGHEVTTMMFKGDVLTTAFSLYASTDTTCGTAQLSLSTAATFTIGAASAVEAGAKEIDIKPNKMELTLYAADFVGSYNDMKYCGFDDWSAGVARDIINLKCSEGDSKKSETHLDIFKIDGKSLTWGEVDDGDDGTAAARPKKLDATEVYKKQGA